MTLFRRGGYCSALLVLALVSACYGQQHKAFTAAADDRELAFTVGGRVLEVPVKEGERVEQGQPLIVLDDEEGALLVELYRLRAESDVKVRAAAAELDQKRTDLKRVESLRERDAAGPYELERAQLEVLIGELALEDARFNREDLQQQLTVYEARHRQHTLRAPIAGVVDRVVPQQGESVEPLKPVLRLVNTDTLWIETPVPTDQTLSLKVGDPAWVRYALPGQEKPVQGRIIHIASVADPTSQDRLVRVELPNPDGLPAGAHVTVSLTAPAGEMAAIEAQGERQ